MVIDEAKELDRSKLISQVENEYQAGLLYVQKKRIQYRNRLLKRGTQTKDPEKININMIANAVDTLIASQYTNEPQIQYVPRDGFIGQEKADILNYTFAFDNQEEDYQQLQYQTKQDKLFYGCGIRVRIGWDNIAHTNIFTSMNPLSFIPDPLPSQNGRFNGQNYRFFGFELQTTFFDLLNEKDGRGECVYEKETLESLIREYMTTEAYLNHSANSTALNYNFPFNNITENFSVYVYHHFTQFGGKRYRVTTTGDRQGILKIVELPLILKEEKKRGYARRPWSITYWKPRRNDPFGESVCDKLEDKQTAKTILFNLNIIKAKKEALGGDFIWNSRLIKNRDDILKPTTNGRNIFVNTDENLSNVGLEIPRSQVKGDAFTMINSLDNEARFDVSMDSQQYGIASDKSMTASETQTVQQNSNIKTILTNNIDLRGEKDFGLEWLKGYIENYSQKDKKLIVLKPDFEYKNITIERDAFDMINDPYVAVLSSADVKAKREKEAMFRDKRYAVLSQDQTITDVERRIYKRMMLRSNGKTPNEINLMCKLGEDERKAIQYLNMINLDIKPESIFQCNPERLRTYRVYFQKADDNDTKQAVLDGLQKALGSMQKPQQQGGMSQTANAQTNAMLGSAIAQQGGQQAQSRQNALPGI